MNLSKDAEYAAKRQQGLQRVREWFAPALAPDEVLIAALAATPFDLSNPYNPRAMVNSLVGTGKALVGKSQERVLLLTDRAIHVVSRRFWKRRFKGLLVSYPARTVPVTLAGRALVIGDNRYFPNAVGFQLGGVVGSQQDVQLFLGAGRPG